MLRTVTGQCRPLGPVLRRWLATEPAKTSDAAKTEGKDVTVTEKVDTTKAAPATASPPVQVAGSDSQSSSGKGNGKEEKKEEKKSNSTVVSFLLGFSSAAAIGLWYLSEDVASSTAALERKIDDLHAATNKYVFSVNQINHLAEELKKLQHAAATKQEVASIRADLANSKNEIEVAFAEHKANVWDTQQDVHRVLEKLSPLPPSIIPLNNSK